MYKCYHHRTSPWFVLNLESNVKKANKKVRRILPHFYLECLFDYLGNEGEQRFRRIWQVAAIIMKMAMKASLMLLLIASTPGEGETWGDNNGKLSGVTIQSLSSTQLRAWAMLDCPFSCLNFHPLDSVWLDTRKVELSASKNTYVGVLITSTIWCDAFKL